MTEPVTVVIPSLNQARYLPGNRIGSEAVVATEIFVMDGGSTDGSVAIIKTMKMIWRHAPDGGQAAVINAGVALAALLCAGRIR